MRILNAIAELIEAKAELIREEAAVVGMEHVEVVYTSEDGSPEDD
jgi:hypothetical protein